MIPNTEVDQLIGSNGPEFNALMQSLHVDSPAITQINAVAALAEFFNRLKNTYDGVFPNGAENYTVSKRLQNLSTSEQRATYTFTFDFQIDANRPLPLTPIAPTP